MTALDSRYDEGYWEHGQGSNYVGYGDDAGWVTTAAIMAGLFDPDRYPEVLEVGCAKGYFLRAAWDEGYRAFGCDVSQWALSHPAPGMGDAMRVGSAVDLPYGDAMFDLVCSWEVLEHIEEQDIRKALAEMERVLRPGGILVHRIGTLEDADDVSNHLQDCTHVLNEPRVWWERLVGEVGWRRLPEHEAMFDSYFAGRDWAGRFFVCAPAG